MTKKMLRVCCEIVRLYLCIKIVIHSLSLQVNRLHASYAAWEQLCPNLRSSCDLVFASPLYTTVVGETMTLPRDFFVAVASVLKDSGTALIVMPMIQDMALLESAATSANLLVHFFAVCCRRYVFLTRWRKIRIFLWSTQRLSPMLMFTTGECYIETQFIFWYCDWFRVSY